MSKIAAFSSGSICEGLGASFPSHNLAGPKTGRLGSFGPAFPAYLNERRPARWEDLEQPSPYFVRDRGDCIEIGRWGGVILISHESEWVLDDYIISAGRMRHAYCASARVRGSTATTSLARVLLGITDKDLVADHINGDTLDNRLENLRVCTRSQNAANTTKSNSSWSKFKGVTRMRDRWQAAIYSGKSKIEVAYFDTEIEAARAYDEMARKMFGEFACVNFAREGEQSVFRKVIRINHEGKIQP